MTKAAEKVVEKDEIKEPSPAVGQSSIAENPPILEEEPFETEAIRKQERAVVNKPERIEVGDPLFDTLERIRARETGKSVVYNSRRYRYHEDDGEFFYVVDGNDAFTNFYPQTSKTV